MHAPDHSVSDAIVMVLSTVAFLEALVFLILYLAFFNWRKTPAGRAVAAVIGSFVVIATSSFLFTLLGPEYWGRDFLRVAVWLLGAGSFGALLLALGLAWLRGHPEPLVVEPRTATGDFPAQPTQPEPGQQQ